LAKKRGGGCTRGSPTSIDNRFQDDPGNNWEKAITPPKPKISGLAPPVIKVGSVYKSGKKLKGLAAVLRNHTKIFLSVSDEIMSYLISLVPM